MGVLEPLGITHHLRVTSSYRKGIHIYTPFANKQKSWAIALVIRTLLVNAGFKLQPGQLEIFPNPKAYSDDQITSYKAHRLPLQHGSDLLNEDWEPVSYRHEAFVSRWQFAQSQNVIDSEIFQRVLSEAREKRTKIHGSAAKYLSDLNTEIEPGWTGHGQTNKLLECIAKRAYIFHHAVYGGEPLQGRALVDGIVLDAIALPGYTEWCRHQDEIEQRAKEWARWVEKNPKYYPYQGKAIGVSKPVPEGQLSFLQPGYKFEMNWNQHQAKTARERIKTAVAQLLEAGLLPAGKTARLRAIREIAGCSNETLYKHQSIWWADLHPIQDTDETAEITTAENVDVELVTPCSLNELCDLKSVALLAAPTGQASSGLRSSIANEERGESEGGQKLGKFYDLNLDDLDPETWERVVCASLFCLCWEESTRLGWSREVLSQYALNQHGRDLDQMDSIRLDGLLTDLMQMESDEQDE
jgi:hypothetical protein